uniref:Uncharacterized protein n=1 Tax=Rhizophora mucronata TaxID=61149 RepID=A0A2P2MYD7_RHIMU
MDLGLEGYIYTLW